MKVLTKDEALDLVAKRQKEYLASKEVDEEEIQIAKKESSERFIMWIRISQIFVKGLTYAKIEISPVFIGIF